LFLAWELAGFAFLLWSFAVKIDLLLAEGV
jgi:hypothetical protein